MCTYKIGHLPPEMFESQTNFMKHILPLVRYQISQIILMLSLNFHVFFSETPCILGSANKKETL